MLARTRWREVQAIFQSPAATPARERERIGLAVAHLEHLVGAVTGTSADLGGNESGAGTPGQMDCIDESTNTTTYLRLFQAHGLLRWHQVRERKRRAKWLFDVHWTAVVRETGQGQDYAVDSWFYDNGVPPFVHPLDLWLSKRGDPDY